MIGALKPIALAAAFVLAGSLDYNPQMLSVDLADGNHVDIAATSPRTCNEAILAFYRGYWRLDSEVVAASCEPGNGFAPGSDKIPGFNER